MLFYLVKKDFLIVKKHLPAIYALCFILPVFFMYQMADYAGVIDLVFCNIYGVIMILHFISMKEYQYPKASTLLCSTPYPRELLVLSKYVVCLINFAICCIICWVVALLFSGFLGLPMEISLRAKTSVLVFFVLAILLGVYLPLQYKFGFEKTRLIVKIALVVTPFLLTPLYTIEMGRVDPNFFMRLPAVPLYGTIVLLGLAILILSAAVSVQIYRKQDLA